MGTVMLRGILVSGLGQGRAFTALDWVRAQFLARLGIDPYPGTLNVRLEAPAEQAAWERLRALPGITIEPISPEFCEARAYLVRVAKGYLSVPLKTAEGQQAAIILPNVPDYPHNQVELVAAVNLRRALGLVEGDAVSVWVDERYLPQNALQGLRSP
ncbi:MAG: DUF120 domain-containing protein [Ardenticatenia bacterium]|nr:DUF120 domain-containing protein [Ardenticatenia bacterium]